MKDYCGLLVYIIALTKTLKSCSFEMCYSGICYYEMWSINGISLRFIVCISSALLFVFQHLIKWM